MAYEFTETFNLTLPDVEEQLVSFGESDFNKSHGLVIEIAAIHEGTTANFNHYEASELQESLASWTTPYPKPIILNHDVHTEPIGRVMGAKMDKEDDGTPYVRLQVAILDPEAIKKVSDGRYLTGSVGGKAKEAVCSVCDVDWAAPRETRGLPCRHQRGKVYQGKVATLKMRSIGFKEYSFVNVPADDVSSIRKVGASEQDDSWVKPAKFFVLDMETEGIVEYAESEGERNVLEGMKKKDSAPLYMGLKGAFLSALAIHEAEMEELSAQEVVLENNNDTNNSNDVDSTEENVMTTDAPVEHEDDILAVSEGLSEDLEAAAATDEEETPQEDETDEISEDEETPAEEVETSEDEEEEASEETEATEEEDTEEEARPQGQEKPHASDVDPETSEGAPVSRESDEEDSEESDAEESEAASDEEVEETELNEETEDEVVEPRVEELEAEVAALKVENTKLRTALHRTLVERVVDAKIAVGMVEYDTRKEAIEEHATRSASSLADSLRDLATMPVFTKRPSMDGLEMDQKLEVVGNEGNVTTIGEEEDQEVEVRTPLQAAEDKFVDIFTGRLKLNS